MILRFLRELRQSHPDMESVFLNGSCMNLWAILKTLFPDAVPYYNSDHIITKIGSRFYDITGEVDPKGYLKFTDYFDKERTKRAFQQMYDLKFK